MDLTKAYNTLPELPPKYDIEKKTILNQAIKANIELAKLNGFCSLLPNDSILLSSIVLKEAEASSEIENIITTQDELYRAISGKNIYIDQNTKEVLNYRTALFTGYEEIKKRNIITTNMIIKIQSELEGNSAGIRKLPGTNLTNETTGEVIYTPPDNESDINRLLKNLEDYMNIDDSVDSLIKMAVIHYQFESIHPFYDGNGRTGRIMNVLYLVKQKLLNSPILFLSKYIINNKNRYYTLLQGVRTENIWEEWIIYILQAVEETAKESLGLISDIVNLMENTVEFCKEKLPKTSYSKELIEALFTYPYTKIEYLVNARIAERRTASKYLRQLEDIGVLESFRLGKENIFINSRLFELLKG